MCILRPAEGFRARLEDRPMPARSRTRPARRSKSAAGNRAARASGPRVRWRGLTSPQDARGRDAKRFYKPETLAAATELLLERRNQFLLPSVQAVLGPLPVSTLDLELCIETETRLVFRLRAANVKRRRASFALIAAKHPDFGKALAAEHATLKRMHGRAPKLLLKPYGGGAVHLPDRHRRASHGRDVFVYLAQWPSGFNELGVGPKGCFFVGGTPIQPLTAAQTEDLKARMIALVVSTFDRGRRDCIGLPDVTQGDLLATRPQRGALRLKLLACRGVIKRATPAKLIHGMLDASFTHRGMAVSFAPEDAARVFEGLSQAVGADGACEWLGLYRKAVASGALREQAVLSLDTLAAMGIE